MGKRIYGVDLNNKLTPLMVRDAIVNCFLEAHDDVLEMIKDYYKVHNAEELNDLKEAQVKGMISAIFTEIGSNFESPKKEDLKKVIDRLKEISIGFRDKVLVEQHHNEISQLIDRIE